MSLPYRVSDHVEFHVVWTGHYEDTLVIDEATGTPKLVSVFIPAAPTQIIPGGDKYERSIDVLLRADPKNMELAEVESPDKAVIFVGDSTRQDFPLRPNESLNVRVTRRNGIWFRAGSFEDDGSIGTGPGKPMKLHIVTAVLNVESR